MENARSKKAKERPSEVEVLQLEWRRVRENKKYRKKYGEKIAGQEFFLV